MPEVTKPSLSQPTAASPIGSSPSPPVNGGNNAKRVAVPNGQPPSAARYMPREVPPRFRCQQDHKVLLKRGQPPPPSCMLLGGGAGPPPPTAPGANSNNAQVTGTLLQSDGGTAPGEESGSGSDFLAALKRASTSFVLPGIESPKGFWGHSQDRRGSLHEMCPSTSLLKLGFSVQCVLLAGEANVAVIRHPHLGPFFLS